MADQWPPDTLPFYISGRREFDNKTVTQVWAMLKKQGKLKGTETYKDIEDACSEARRLFELYLR